MTFESYLAQTKEAVEAILDRHLPTGETFPPRLHQAMRYSVEAGGKRLRPILCLAVGELLGGEAKVIEPLAAAIELIHTCSLVLDDLPCMDDGIERRGRPSLHLTFDESTALLAGEALLMRAYEIVGQALSESSLKAREAGEVVQLFGSILGSAGMIAGQQVDLQMVRSRLDVKVMEYRHSRKTGSLFHLAVKAPALLCQAPIEALNALEIYAKNLGLAFQIADDLQEKGASAAESGKSSRRQAPTFVDLCGESESKALFAQLVQTAEQSLAVFSGRAKRLAELSRYIGQRVT
ncbi:MAG: polyprenyl synthetase family protein [Planctomycetota bacterium]